MSLDTLRGTLPAYAKDLSLNLSSLAGETVLTDQQKWGAFLASAHAVGQPAVVSAVEAAAVEKSITTSAAASAVA
jgi:alkyl hydroperoxide reductase subunit D